MNPPSPQHRAGTGFELSQYLRFNEWRNSGLMTHSCAWDKPLYFLVFPSCKMGIESLPDVEQLEPATGAGGREVVPPLYKIG